MNDITVRAVEALSVDTRPFDFTEISETRPTQRTIVAATVAAAVAVLVLAVAVIVLR